MKAWEVRTDSSEFSTIVYADTRNQARSMCVAGEGFEWDSYIDIKAKRLPEIDDMEDREPKDNYWLNDEIRMILVRERGWTCYDKTLGDCQQCPAKKDCIGEEE